MQLVVQAIRRQERRRINLGRRLESAMPARPKPLRGKPRQDKKTGEIIRPKKYQRTDATVDRYIATLSHLLSLAVTERRLIDRNPAGDIRRKKEARGRTRFLSHEEQAALLDAWVTSNGLPLYALVLLAITTGARCGELLSLKWADRDRKTGCALLHDTKNGEQRTLPLAGKALKAHSSRRGAAARRRLPPAPLRRPNPDRPSACRPTHSPAARRAPRCFQAS